MYYLIYVRGQADYKMLYGDKQVETNRGIEVIKSIKDLKPMDSFLLNGIWYDIFQMFGPLNDIEAAQYKSLYRNIQDLQRMINEHNLQVQTLLENKARF